MKAKVQHSDLAEIVQNSGRTYSKILGLGALVLLSLTLAAVVGTADAQDLTWDDGAGTGDWNTNDANWSGATWNNNVPDNAIFALVGGTINLTVPITAGDITFGSEYQSCANASFNGGSLQAAGLTVQGRADTGPYDTATNFLTLDVSEVSIAGDVAVGRSTLAITNGSLEADQIISAPDSPDWADFIISGDAVVMVTNGIDGSANTSQTFALDLDGGTLYTPSINVADRHREPFAGYAFFNWNGGKVVATASTANFITLYGAFDFYNNVYINNGGAILDTAGYNVGIGVNLVALGNGGFTKLGAGTLTLSGTNDTYIGDTIIDEGTLVISYPSLATSSAVIINTNAVLSLNFAGTNTVGALIIDGVSMPSGVYNVSTTPAQINGSGSLLVPAFEPKNLVWNNGAGTGNWNTTDTNWTGAIWDNSALDNALFTSTWGAINLTVPINAGSITFANEGDNWPNSSLNGGSLQADSLTVYGNDNYNDGPTNAFNVLTLDVPTVSFSGDVAVGASTLAIATGSFTANEIISYTASADWADVKIAGDATVVVTNGINGSSSPSTIAWTFALDLDGGTLYTPYIYMRTADFQRAGGITWNGGKVVATASTNNFITLYGDTLFTNAINIGDGGAILDTAGYNIGISASLVASGAGGLTKLGAGTLTLDATNNTYTGETTVNGGTLAIDSPTLATNSTVVINSTAVLSLNFAGENAVGGLIIGGVAMPPGVYNASTTPANIGGSGSLLVSALAVLPINLNITRSGSNLVLTWNGGGLIQSSTNAVGPYNDTIGSSSPWTIAPTNAQMYFRVKQ